MKTPADIIKEIFPTCCHDRIFLVGGCVRDLLLQRPINDIDLLCALSPADMSANGFHLVAGKTTAPLWLRHSPVNGAIEATLIPDMQHLQGDLSRRDFTINALVMTLNGELFDPLNGKTDLEQGRLHACSIESFRDDPLRLFRAFRLESDHWDMDAETEQLARETSWDTALTTIPVERFSREMLKALELSNPARFFLRMLDFNIGKGYLPELFRMPQIPAGPLVHHPEGDLFAHSCEVLQRVAAMTSDPLTRFCAFFHDLGKLATSPDLYPRHHGHDHTGYDLALEFCRRLRLPTQYGTALAWVSRLHTTFNTWDELRESTKMRVAGQALKAGIVDILPLVAAADKNDGNEPEEWRRIVGIAGMSATELGVDHAALRLVAPQKRTEYLRQIRLRMMKRTASTAIRDLEI